MMRKNIDMYTLHARFFPAIITALPLFVLWFFLSQDVSIRLLGEFLLSLKFYGAVTFSAVFLYFYAQVIRITSKHFEAKYFLNDRGFPTTYLLTYADPMFSKDFKDKFRALVKSNFGLDLLSADEEEENLSDASTRIAEAVKLVIVKFGTSRLVSKHNIWYGFFRNLVGGCLYGMLFSAAGGFWGAWLIKSNVLIVASTALFLLYLVLFLWRKRILVQNGEAYARQLISEFLVRAESSSVAKR
jgi:hypothetical protein